jgi:hypothetical protein
LEKKNRVPIEPKTAADIMFAADRTCCICRERGRPVQIHHIDDDPSNNDHANLVVLCLLCHNETQVRGGFGRRLDAMQVRTYREDWIKRIASRRDEADRLSADVLQEQGFSVQISRPAIKTGLALDDFIWILPELRRRVRTVAQPEWDSGISSNMINGNNTVIKVLEDILVSLAMYYPEGHFDKENPRDYFSELITSRFRWHRYHIETSGQESGGTITGVLVGGSVINDLQEMIVDIVTSLVMQSSASDNFDMELWREKWRHDFNDFPSEL